MRSLQNKTRARLFWPVFILFKLTVRLPGRSCLPVAIIAINRTVAAGLEGHFGRLAARSACNCEHLALGPVVTASSCAAYRTLGFSRRPALRTAFWLVSITSLLEKFLLSSAENKGCPAIRTLKSLIRKSHWMTSSLLHFS
jgi:hypothetical protein